LNRKKDNQQYTHYLKGGDNINFSLDDSTSHRSNLFYTYEIGDREFLAFENEFKNGITIYHLDDQTLFKDIKIPTEGPHGIRKIHGFTIVSHDSIFVYDSYQLSNALLINLDSKFIDRLNLTRNAESNVFSHASMTRNPSVYFEGDIYFIQFSNSPSGRSEDFEFAYNIKNGTMIGKGITRPEIYGNKIWGLFHSYPNRSKGPGSTFVYSWGIDSDIYVTDFKNELKSFQAKSDYFDNINPITSNQITSEVGLKYYAENDIYDVIFWDKYRKVYYRFARQGTPYLDSKTGRIANGEDKSCSIIILDENFKKIGETLLSQGKYFIRDSYVSRKGLCISNSHYRNPNLNESIMSFTVFSLNKY
jgi:hypothetical protein